MDNTSAGSLMVDHLPPAFQHLRRRRFEQLLLAGEVVAKRPNPTSAASMISWMLALSPPLGDQPHRGADQRLRRPRLCAGSAGSPPAPRLRTVARRWRFLVAGAKNEDNARELASQIGREAPADPTVRPGHSPVYPLLASF